MPGSEVLSAQRGRDRQPLGPSDQARHQQQHRPDRLGRRHLVARAHLYVLLSLQSKPFWKQREDSTMPHLTVRVPEAQLVGREQALIAALTDAVAEVYGQWARGTAR